MKTLRQRADPHHRIDRIPCLVRYPEHRVDQIRKRALNRKPRNRCRDGRRRGDQQDDPSPQTSRRFPIHNQENSPETDRHQAIK